MTSVPQLCAPSLINGFAESVKLMSPWGCAVIHFSLAGLPGMRGRGMSAVPVSVLVCRGDWTQGVDTVFLRQISYPVLRGSSHWDSRPGPSLPEVPASLRGSKSHPQGLGPHSPSGFEVGGCLSGT